MRLIDADECEERLWRHQFYNPRDTLTAVRVVREMPTADARKENADKMERLTKRGKRNEAHIIGVSIERLICKLTHKERINVYSVINKLAEMRIWKNRAD